MPTARKLPSGSWQSNNTGWWYRNADGSYPANTWSLIGGSWYYFNAGGYMAASQWIGNYYVGSDGAMWTNTWTPDGFYVGADGEWTGQTYQPPSTPENDINEYSTFYWTPNGKSYHASPDCTSLKRSDTILSGTYSDAIAAGKDDPCNLCVK